MLAPQVPPIDGPGREDCMRQGLFDFVRETWTTSPVTLDPAIEDEVVTLMAAMILAACGKGGECDDDEDEAARHREDHE